MALQPGWMAFSARRAADTKRICWPGTMAAHVGRTGCRVACTANLATAVSLLGYRNSAGFDFDAPYEL